MEKYIEFPEVLEVLLGKSSSTPFIDKSLDIGVFKKIVLVDVSKREEGNYSS